MTPIEKIRSEFSLTTAWRILDLPGTPNIGDNHSPFRQDKRASFSIYQAKGHLRWHDHADGQGGDIVDLWAKAKGITVAEAIAEITRYQTGTGAVERYRPSYASGEEKTLTEAPTTFRHPPDLRAPSESECRQLAELRGLLPGAFMTAGNLGTLKVGTIYGVLCWIVTDKVRRCAEARRFDGELFPNGKKGFCLPGSHKDWPLGLVTDRPEFDAIDNLLVVEGQPDYFAALSLAIDSEINIRPIVILGATTPSLNDATEPCIRGKKVLMIGHNDPAGQVAIGKWIKDFHRLGARSVVRQELPFVHDDLNSFLQDVGPHNSVDLLQGFSHDNSPIRSP